MLGRCYIGMVSEWGKHSHKMWVCGFHGRIKEYTYWKQLERLKSILIDLPTYIFIRVLVLFHCFSICSFLQKKIFTSGFCSFMVKFEEKYPFLFNFFFFYKIQYYRVGQISVDSLNKFIKGKKMNLPSK